MLILITYDVNTVDAEGRRRLRQVAKTLIDPQKDSLRFYTLGNQYQSKVEHVGAHPAYQPDGVLMV